MVFSYTPAMIPMARKVLAIRAAGVLVLGFGIPELASVLTELIQHPAVLALSRGHAGAWLGALGVILSALAEVLTARAIAYLLLIPAGFVLLRAGSHRLLGLAARVERL